MGGYILLFFVGALGSSALVIPGISGSMLLLILGYYNPIVNLATDHLLVGKDVGLSILVLGVTAIGIAIGFVAISVVMKILFKKCPRGTYFAIIGFIILPNGPLNFSENSILLPGKIFLKSLTIISSIG